MTLIWFPQMFNPQVVCVRRQWSCDQNDHERQEFNNETCFQNPQSCVRYQIIWTQKSKSSTSIPKTNLPTSQPKEISRVMNEIICCVCSTSTIQSVVKRWRKDYNKIRWRASHNEIATNESHCKGSLENLSSSTSESLGKRTHGNQDPWSRGVRKLREG